MIMKYEPKFLSNHTGWVPSGSGGGSQPVVFIWGRSGFWGRLRGSHCKVSLQFLNNLKNPRKSATFNDFILSLQPLKGPNPKRAQSSLCTFCETFLPIWDMTMVGTIEKYTSLRQSTFQMQKVTSSRITSVKSEEKLIIRHIIWWNM